MIFVLLGVSYVEEDVVKASLVCQLDVVSHVIVAVTSVEPLSIVSIFLVMRVATAVAQNRGTIRRSVFLQYGY